jgi:hypothetical protein
VPHSPFGEIMQFVDWGSTANPDLFVGRRDRETPYLPPSRSEAAVKGARSEPRSGRRPLTAKPCGGYVSALPISVFSRLSATALLQFR